MSLVILVVDDDPDISLMLNDRLTYLGFHAASANNGAEGMALLDQLTVDGILLDIQMPVMDGLTMLKHVRQRHPHMPVIMMTAELNKKSLNQAMEQGAQDYLLKPIDVDLLTKKCSTVFSSN